MLRTQGVLLQSGKHSGFVKASPSFRAVMGFVRSGVR